MPIIRINLLPPEKRRRERTPLSRYIALIVGTSVNAAIVLFMAKTALDTHDLKMQSEKITKEISATKRAMIPDIDKKRGRPGFDETKAANAEYDKTKSQVEKITTRKNAIEALKKERILSWAEVIDSICDVMAANPWVWLTQLEMGEGTKGPKGSAQLDLYVQLSCNSTASQQDCELDKVGEVMTKFKLDLWDKFKVGPGTDTPEIKNERKFPFDWTDENFPIVRTDSEKYRETVQLSFTATVGRKPVVAAKPPLGTKK